jgi:hypothetical protein
MAEFMPGLELSEMLFREAVAPLIAGEAPDLPYAAGLLGPGSDVLGYDTARSMDHDWGPRLVLFLEHDDLQEWRPRLNSVLSERLPRSIAGHPTGFAEFEEEPGTMHMAEGDGPINHRVTITSAGEWLIERLGIASTRGMTAATWLTLPEQALLEVTAGRVFRDDTGEITTVREDLAWYPEDVWRYRMAAQWQRIDQLEPFVGRCGELDDDLGSQLVAMTLVKDVMKLAFLMERRYAPYAKWLGTAFETLELAGKLGPHLDIARYSRTWQQREAGVVAAVETLARHHNAMGLTGWVDPEPRLFFDRPFRVMFGGRFAAALLEMIQDPEVRALPRHVGGIDQYIDSTDAMNAKGLHRAIREWIADSVVQRHADSTTGGQA